MICRQCVARNNKMSFYVFIILLFILEIMLLNIKTSFMTVHYLPLQMLYRLFSPFFDKLYICLCEILFILCIFPVPKQTRMVASQNSLLQKMVMKRSVYLEFVNCRIISIQNQYYSFPTKMITPQLILCNKQSSVILNYSKYYSQPSEYPAAVHSAVHSTVVDPNSSKFA